MGDSCFNGWQYHLEAHWNVGHATHLHPAPMMGGVNFKNVQTVDGWYPAPIGGRISCRFFFDSPGLKTKMMFPNLPWNSTINTYVLAYLYTYLFRYIYICKQHLPKQSKITICKQVSLFKHGYFGIFVSNIPAVYASSHWAKGFSSKFFWSRSRKGQGRRRLRHHDRSTYNPNVHPSETKGLTRV